MYKAISIKLLKVPAGQLCYRPYIGHKKGCPNYNKKKGCPPAAKRIDKIIDIDREIFAIWNVFDFAKHCRKMKRKHPNWSKRQIECCLYWQGTARKQLKNKIWTFQVLDNFKYYKIIKCPEACGVDVTATMKSIGIELEWPPMKKAYQIVLAGSKL